MVFAIFQTYGQVQREHLENQRENMCREGKLNLEKCSLHAVRYSTSLNEPEIVRTSHIRLHFSNDHCINFFKNIKFQH